MNPQNLDEEIRQKVAETVTKYGPIPIMEKLSRIGAVPKLAGKIILIPLDGEDFETCTHFYEISMSLTSYYHYLSLLRRKYGSTLYPNSTVDDSKLPEKTRQAFLSNFRRKWYTLEEILKKDKN